MKLIMFALKTAGQRPTEITDSKRDREKLVSSRLIRRMSYLARHDAQWEQWSEKEGVKHG